MPLEMIRVLRSRNKHKLEEWRSLKRRLLRKARGRRMARLHMCDRGRRSSRSSSSSGSSSSSSSSGMSLRLKRRRFMDEADENFCGYMGLMIVDADGHSKQMKGMQAKGALHMVSHGLDGDPAVLEAEFPHNQFYFIQIPKEDDVIDDDRLYIFGQWWVGLKLRPLTMIGTSMPKSCQVAHREMAASSSSEFSIDVQMPLLRGAPRRLVTAVVTTTEDKLISKATKVRIEIPRASWMEWKTHRLRFWQLRRDMHGSSGSESGGSDSDGSSGGGSSGVSSGSD